MNKMNTIGFVKSDKPFEQRIALLPKDIENIIHRENIYIECGSEGFGRSEERGFLW